MYLLTNQANTLTCKEDVWLINKKRLIMKKLLVIAIAMAVSAPTLAKTKVYGQLHASYDLIDADGPNVKSKKTVSSNSSRLGVKGSADLTDDLKVIYKAEWGIDTGGKDGTKDAKFSNRNQYIGLKGNFGALIIGRHDTPFKTVGRKADLFWSTQLGQNRNVTNPGTWDLRVNNVIAYKTPKFGAFQALAAYVTDSSGSDENNVVSVNGFYESGPLLFGAGYEKHSLENFDRDSYRLMAAYKLGKAKLVGYYQNEDNGGSASGVADATVTGVGAAYKIGAGTIKAQYYTRNIKGTSNDPDLITVGYDRKFREKTDLYVQYAKVSEGAKLGGAGHGESIASSNGGDADGISIGIRHKF